MNLRVATRRIRMSNSNSGDETPAKIQASLRDAASLRHPPALKRRPTFIPSLRDENPATRDQYQISAAPNIMSSVANPSARGIISYASTKSNPHRLFRDLYLAASTASDTTETSP
jgi:hypothetical protein